MISSAVASLIARLRPTRSFLKSVFSPGGGCHAHRRAGICIYDACVDKCVAVLGQAVPAEPPSLPEWALMWDDELLERIPSTSATNIEAGLCDRLRELRDRGMFWARIGVALGMTRQSP
jgi:ATP-dependent Clp protease ATP-binding subunit ClpX